MIRLVILAALVAMSPNLAAAASCKPASPRTQIEDPRYKESRLQTMGALVALAYKQSQAQLDDTTPERMAQFNALRVMQLRYVSSSENGILEVVLQLNSDTIDKILATDAKTIEQMMKEGLKMRDPEMTFALLKLFSGPCSTTEAVAPVTLIK